MKRERTGEEKVRALFEFIDGDESKVEGDIDGMSDEQVDQFLVKAGLNLDDVATRARSEHEEALSALARARSTATATARPGSGSGSGKVVALRPRVSPWVYALPVAASFAALFAFEGSEIVAWVEGELEPTRTMVGNGRDAALPPDIAEARRLRREAEDAIAQGASARALELLDEAKALDPPGDETPEAERLRERAHDRLDAHP